MRVRFRVRALQKSGNSPSEYEDAFYPQTPGDVDAWYFRTAVADGATETSFAREWARELAGGFGHGRLNKEGAMHLLPRLQTRWRSRIDARQSLPWYAQEKLRAGAFSALLGLTVTQAAREQSRPHDVDGRWIAMAVGDSCLFHVREANILRTFPIIDAQEFSSRPQLISSLGRANLDFPSLVREASGGWRSGDRFLLATDAVAHWIMAGDQEGETPIVRLTATMHCQADFEAFVRCRRNAGGMRNDDVTVATVDIEA